MKIAVLLLLSIVLAATAASFLTARTLRAQAPRPLDSNERLERELERLSARLAALETSQERAVAIRELADPVPAATAPRVAVGEIERAVDAWMREHGAAAPAGAAEPLADTTAGVQDGPAPLHEVVRALLAGDSIWEHQDLWEELRETGRISEVVAAFERLAEEDPQNPDAQVALGAAYIQELFGVGSSPRAGELATKADRAYDRALALDPDHWEARFSKAMSLSNWPAFLGKTGEAIRQFETLVEQQERSAPSRRHAQTYLYLGNLLMQTGERDKALAAWRRGLGLYPDDEALAQQIAVNAEN